MRERLQQLIDTNEFEFLKTMSEEDIWKFAFAILYVFSEHNVNGYTQCFKDASFGQWIPISEKLPEENETVIASTEYGVYPEAKYTKEYGWEWAYEAGADYWRELEGVTAWMPLPEPYEPQESEAKK